MFASLVRMCDVVKLRCQFSLLFWLGLSTIEKIYVINFKKFMYNFPTKKIKDYFRLKNQALQMAQNNICELN